MTLGCGADCPCRVPRRFGERYTVFSTGEKAKLSFIPHGFGEVRMRWIGGALLCLAGVYVVLRSCKKLGEYPANIPVMR